MEGYAVVESQYLSVSLFLHTGLYPKCTPNVLHFCELHSQMHTNTLFLLQFQTLFSEIWYTDVGSTKQSGGVSQNTKSKCLSQDN